MQSFDAPNLNKQYKKIISMRRHEEKIFKNENKKKRDAKKSSNLIKN